MDEIKIEQDVAMPIIKDAGKSILYKIIARILFLLLVLVTAYWSVYFLEMTLGTDYSYVVDLSPGTALMLLFVLMILIPLLVTGRFIDSMAIRVIVFLIISPVIVFVLKGPWLVFASPLYLGILVGIPFILLLVGDYVLQSTKKENLSKILVVVLGIILVINFMVIFSVIADRRNKEASWENSRLLTANAWAQNDASLCEKIDESTGGSKDWCLVGVAKYGKQFNLCDKIAEYRFKEACIYDAVKQTGDLGFCEKLTNGGEVTFQNSKTNCLDGSGVKYLFLDSNSPPNR